MARVATPVGNRLVLVGAIVYLLEWAAIVPVTMMGEFGPFGPAQRPTDEVMALYASSARPTAFLAAWLALVLVGRVVLMMGIRDAVRAAGRPGRLADAAVAVMALSVTIEVVSFGLVPAAGFLAAAGGDPASVLALDAASYWLFWMVFAPLGASVLLGGLALWRSRAVGAAWGISGAAIGALVLLYGLLGPATDAAPGALAAIAEGFGIGMPLFWMWVLALGVLLVRRAGRRAPGEAADPSTA